MSCCCSKLALRPRSPRHRTTQHCLPVMTRRGQANETGLICACGCLVRGVLCSAVRTGGIAPSAITAHRTVRTSSGFHKGKCKRPAEIPWDRRVVSRPPRDDLHGALTCSKQPIELMRKCHFAEARRGAGGTAPGLAMTYNLRCFFGVTKGESKFASTGGASGRELSSIGGCDRG